MKNQDIVYERPFTHNGTQNREKRYNKRQNKNKNNEDDEFKIIILVLPCSSGNISAGKVAKGYA